MLEEGTELTLNSGTYQLDGGYTIIVKDGYLQEYDKEQQEMARDIGLMILILILTLLVVAFVASYFHSKSGIY